MSSICLNRGMSAPAKTDGRREAGEQTRRRLLEAALQLLAERGEDAVTLRDITSGAQANVAAVSYHFGSKDALVTAAIEHALRRVLAQQRDTIRGLGDAATLHGIAATLAAPAIDAIAGDSPENRAVLRIAARASVELTEDPPEWLAELRAEYRSAIVDALRRPLPGLGADVLAFRSECATAILYSASIGRMRSDIGHLSAAELEQQLVPVIAGALAGDPP
jgi:AcrR family transcriptional regulator